MFEDILFPDEFKGFSRPEYLMILLSFVYGMALSDQFYHYSLMIRKRKFHIETVLWSNLLIIAVINYWFFLWRHIDLIDDRLVLYIALFITPAIFFIIVAFLYPDASEDYDLKKNFEKNSRHIFIFAAAMLFSQVLTSFVFNNTITAYNWVRVGMMMLLVLSSTTSKTSVRNSIGGLVFIWFMYLFFFSGI